MRLLDNLIEKLSGLATEEQGPFITEETIYDPKEATHDDAKKRE